MRQALTEALGLGPRVLHTIDTNGPAELRNLHPFSRAVNLLKSNTFPYFSPHGIVRLSNARSASAG